MKDKTWKISCNYLTDECPATQDMVKFSNSYPT